MPCMDGGPTREEISRQNQDFEIITKLACRLCKEIEKRGEKVPKFAKDWWERHKLADEERKRLEKVKKEKERRKQNALAKLSPEDKKALGL